jgi:uncharacterized protein DUF4386
MASKARIAGVFYLMVFLTGIAALLAGGRLLISGNAAATATNILAHESLFRLSWASNLIATACYVVVTALFYELFRPVSRSVSMTAAFFSLVGCAIGAVSSVFQLAPLAILKGGQSPGVFTADQLQVIAYMFLKLNGGNIALVFFGFYCLLIGYLIIRSTFLPRVLGVGMVIAGLGWLTFLWPPLANDLSPYILLPGILGEGLLTLWLLAIGVNDERWKEQAAAQS